ncbi:MAG: hypothetical protein J3Q66DRAFT_31611 [Benniella sp.]|nr:MAG: hypothetical protein J3Q66DRAFT_31611 [Benniella sp.]
MESISNPVHFPNEILFYIGLYLKRPYLTRCVLVCRAWRTAMRPLIWSDITFRGNTPVADTIRECPHWIRSVTLDQVSSLDQLGALKACSRLESLSMDDIVPIDYQTVVRTNRLRHLWLYRSAIPREASQSGRPWCPFPILANTSNHPSVLTSLRLDDYRLINQFTNSFWKICTNLEVLELRNVVIERDQIIQTNPTFPKLQELALIECPFDASTQLMRIIGRAPRLRKLTWHSWNGSKSQVNGFISLFKEKRRDEQVPGSNADGNSLQQDICESPYWPDLESISILHSNARISIEQYLIIVENTAHLRKIDVILTEFSLSAFNILTQRHSQTLREIDWQELGAKNVPQWIQIVLSTCPMLTHVVCQVMLARNVIEEGHRWVCRDRLQELRTCIDLDPKKFNLQEASVSENVLRHRSRAVYNQLSGLRALCVLDLRHPRSRSGSNFRLFGIQPLTASLTMGMDELSQLRCLEQFSFYGVLDLTKEDVRWMIEHWPFLKLVHGGHYGITNHGYPWSTELRRILNDSGIQAEVSWH